MSHLGKLGKYPWGRESGVKGGKGADKENKIQYYLKSELSKNISYIYAIIK